MARPVVTIGDLVGLLRAVFAREGFDVDAWAAGEAIDPQALVHVAAFLAAVVEQSGVGVAAAQLTAFSAGWDAHKALRGERDG